MRKQLVQQNEYFVELSEQWDGRSEMTEGSHPVLQFFKNNRDALFITFTNGNNLTEKDVHSETWLTNLFQVYKSCADNESNYYVKYITTTELVPASTFSVP